MLKVSMENAKQFKKEETQKCKWHEKKVQHS